MVDVLLETTVPFEDLPAVLAIVELSPANRFAADKRQLVSTPTPGSALHSRSSPESTADRGSRRSASMLQEQELEQLEAKLRQGRPHAVPVSSISGTDTTRRVRALPARPRGGKQIIRRNNKKMCVHVSVLSLLWLGCLVCS